MPFIAPLALSTLAVLIAAAPESGAPSQPAPASDAIEKIAAYAGTWHVHLEYVATKYSKARVDDSTLRNDCRRSGGYFSCNQYVNGTSVVLLTFTYDAAHALYHSYQIPPDGGAPHEGSLTIAGDTWTFPWTDKDGGATVYFRVVNVFSDPDTIRFRQEFSSDGEHWTVSGTGEEHRIAPL
jgi:hypothetical protein